MGVLALSRAQMMFNTCGSIVLVYKVFQCSAVRSRSTSGLLPFFLRSGLSMGGLYFLALWIVRL